MLYITFLFLLNLPKLIMSHISLNIQQLDDEYDDLRVHHHPNNRSIVIDTTAPVPSRRAQQHRRNRPSQRTQLFRTTGPRSQRAIAREQRGFVQQARDNRYTRFRRGEQNRRLQALRRRIQRERRARNLLREFGLTNITMQDAMIFRGDIMDMITEMRNGASLEEARDIVLSRPPQHLR